MEGPTSKDFHLQSEEPNHDFNRFDPPTILGAIFTLFII